MFIGLVGKPSCGKSTFFKALTLMDVAIANYPFTTIKPNSGYGHIRLKCVDSYFKTQCNPREGYCSEHSRFVPVQMLDVAGLVPGAHEGKGLGLEFLNDLGQADVLIHIVDISGSLNEKGEPVPRGSYDPEKDILFLEHELDMWYYQIFQRVWKKFSYTINQTKQDAVKAIAEQFSGIKINEELVKVIMKQTSLDQKSIINWSDDDVKKFSVELRRKSKPIIVAANKVDIPGAYDNYVKISKKFSDYIIIPCSAESELALKEAARHGLISYLPGDHNFVTLSENLNEKQKSALNFMQNAILNKYENTGVQEVINKAVFSLLKYIAIFPVANNKLTDADGRVLPDCYLLPDTSTPLDLAYKIHTSIGEKFMKAIDMKTNLPMKKERAMKNLDVVQILTK